ncbi:phytanoyl-CoA dioxygenase family protein [Paremcibacter congregatus]|uniref:phytanoyl-CoA dioxygenase family protein n=1 Tax=Paremcibacter congregatus TaxID=2043170 RepID=UPI0030EDA615|tara:strand:+ start:871 stop:1737 length:867 start_codon:yes stop_codon:yes gene_type:complete
MKQRITQLKRRKAVDTLRSKGYVILENMISPDLLSNVSQELDQWFAKTPRCQGDFYGEDTTRYGSLLTKAPSSQDLALHPDISYIADEILGPNCDWYQLNLGQAVRIHPGAPQQPPHRDEEMWPCPKSCEYLINVMWAIDDFTLENGATRIWPRSHFASLNRDMDEAEAIVAEMPKGSALIFLGSVTHCGGANRYFEHRTGIIFSYSLGWLKQYENQFLAYPPKVAATFPPELQALIGYKVHRPNLGGYENNCPSVLLQETIPETLPAVDCLPPEIEQQLAALRSQAA